MNDINFLRNISNINKNLDVNSVKNSQSKNQDLRSDKSTSFEDLLNKKLGQLEFSKHATKRISEREIKLDADTGIKLNEALDQAKTKGLRNVLVMIENSAFILDTASNKVVTAVGKDDLRENIFTNIDGAVIK